jgi:hypothetical protein
MMKRAEDTNIAEFSSGDNRQSVEERREREQRAYLLRCWWERTTLGPLWRFSVEEVFGERRRYGFSSPGALVAFIRGELREADSDSDEG